MNKIKCPNCKKQTSDEKQFCEHCLFNVHYQSIFNVKSTAPWVRPVDTHKLTTDSEASQKYYDYVEEEAKKWTNTGHWRRREEERKRYIKSQKAEWMKRGARPDEREEIMKS